MKDYDLTSLKTMACSASALATPVITGLHQKFNASKQHIQITQGIFVYSFAKRPLSSHYWSGYGLTEITGGALMMVDGGGPQDVGSIGSLVPNMEARIVDDDGNDVPQGENPTGELWLRGPNVTKVHTAENILRGLFLMTSSIRDTSTTKLRPEKQ